MIIIQPKGGLGNILFIVANGLSLAEDYKMKILVNADYRDKRKNIKEYRLFKNLKFVDIKFINILKNVTVYNEKKFDYFPVMIDKDCINYIDGYFQSYKYFIHNVDKIKKILWDNVQDLEKEAEDEVKKISQGKKTIMLHIRRGDYLNLPDYHPTQTDAYYHNTLLDLVDNPNEYMIVVFSDDIEYAKKIKNFDFYDKYFVTEEDPEKAFLMMTKCDDYILANSSMSLLAYYFRDKKDARCRGPTNWFGPKGPKYNIRSLLSNEIKLFS